ncbi:hypothetical protein Lser_V15G35342 [Lactuca serriola]
MIRKSKRLTMGEHRGDEQHEIEHICDMVDYISNLPDCIVHHILSFMPTKEVVKTSILSTRWKNLWASAPTIDFDDLLFCSVSDIDYDDLFVCDRKVHDRRQPDVTSFMNFIERVLRLRGVSNIIKFRLTCVSSYEESQIQNSQIHSWISDAIMHNVQELDLSLFREDPSMIPWSILDRTSLVSLKIRSNYYVTELPSCISFPCLKTLHLLSVVFPDDDHAEKLLLGCPVLEELVLSHNWMNLNNIVISNSTLKSLTIEDILHFQEDILHFQEPLYDPTSVCKIKIDAENLTYFEYIGFLSNEIILSNTSSLVNARVYIPPEWKKEVTGRVIGLLKQLQYVVSLKLCRRTLESLVFADNNLFRFPVFPNLSHLILSMKIGKHTFRVLMDLLSFCPVLQSICFSEGFMRDRYLGMNYSIWSLIPKCISNCLKTLTFKNFHADNSEIGFLKCVLKHACVLERMDVWWSKTPRPDIKKRMEARVEIETMKRNSTACVIKFS